MTSDATDYKYEWDAFYRLRKVKTQSGALVAEYRYNGLGFRIAVHEDTDTDADVDGSDLWYYSAFDERWRMVATYRSSDSNPKERFVHQQAGAGGFGGSSYIDLVAFREKDANTAWTTASDGTLEERLYYCQNQHADVVALITSAGGQREMVRYSAYGVPFGLPEGDSNSDGLADGTDRGVIQGWINGSAYDVRGDVDLDGDVDATDKTTVTNLGVVTLGRGALSAGAVGNQRGMAGYQADLHIAGSANCIRSRWLNPKLGVWTRRDPLTASDSYSVYAYCHSRPIEHQDPMGLTENISLDNETFAIPGTLETYTLNGDAKTIAELSDSEQIDLRMPKGATARITPKADALNALRSQVHCCTTLAKRSLDVKAFDDEYPADTIKRHGHTRKFNVDVDKKKVCIGTKCTSIDSCDSETATSLTTMGL